MAEENPQAEGKKSSSALGIIMVLVGIILVSAICGLLVFQLVLRPQLSGEAADDEAENTELIETAMVSFEGGKTTVKMRDPEVMPSILLYKVSFECANSETASLVDKNKPRFLDMLRRLHSNLTEEDCADPLVPDSIQKQAMQEANDHLSRLQQEDGPELRVTRVFHEEFIPVTP